MVIIDHVDINKLNVGNFRQVNCPCELCDCGCFERMKYKHNPNCKRKSQPKKEKLIAQTSLGCPLSHYRDTFKANPNFRPPSAYLPPPEKYIPQVPMDFNTIQKLEFKPIPLTERVKGFKAIEKYEPPKEPVETTSSYQKEYVSKDKFVKTEIIKKNPNVQTMILSHDKLSDKTTTKEHYKQWSQPEGPVRACTEWPSYAGDALFPTSERSFSTTTAAFHQPMPGFQRSKSFIRLENIGSLRPMGPMDMDTNYRNTYIQHKNFERTKIIDPTKNSARNENKILVPMQALTQTRKDYIFYPNFQRTGPADVDPYVSDLNQQIYPGKIHDLTSSYSSQYKGHDPKLNPKAQSCKKEPEEYKPPVEKIDGETVTMRDFKPIDVTLVPRLKIIKAEPKLKNSDLPMETTTTSQRHFVKYDIKPITLAGDPMPHYFVQTKEKFDCRTTNEDNYYPKAIQKVQSYKPEQHNITNSGVIDLNSNYRNEFVNHGLTMCEAKAYFIAQSMSENNNNNKTADKNKSLNDVRSNSRSNSRASFKMPESAKRKPRVPSSTKYTTSKLIQQVS